MSPEKVLEIINLYLGNIGNNPGVKEDKKAIARILYVTIYEDKMDDVKQGCIDFLIRQWGERPDLMEVYPKIVDDIIKEFEK